MFRNRNRLKKTRANAPTIILGFTEDDSVHHARLANSGEELHDGEPFVHSTLCGASVNYDVCSLKTFDRLISFDNVVDDKFSLCHACYVHSEEMLTGRRSRR